MIRAASLLHSARGGATLRGIGAAALVGSLFFLAASGALAYLTWREPAAARVALRQANGSPRSVRDVPFAEMINDAAFRYRINPALLAAVVAAESRFIPDARSKRGAIGLAQVMPSTWSELRAHVRCPLPTTAGQEACLRDPKINLAAGALYLRRLLTRYNENAELALAAYNAGPRPVDAYSGPPPFPETQRYLDLVALAWTELQATRTLSPTRRLLLSGFDQWTRLRNRLAVGAGVLFALALLSVNPGRPSRRKKGAKNRRPN